MDLMTYLKNFYEANKNNTAVIVLMIAGMVAFFIFKSIVFARIFRKAGKKTWPAWIPFVRTVGLYDIAWSEKWGYAAAVLEVAANLVYPHGLQLIQGGVRSFLFLVVFSVLLCISSIMKIKLAASFGRGPAFGFATIFMQDVFYTIIAFDDSAYLGRTLRKYNDDFIKEVSR